METIRRLFGQRVRQLRLSRGLSQEELAFRAGMHRTYLGGIERGDRNPSLENIAAIAKALDVTLSQLFLFPSSARGHGNMENQSAQDGDRRSGIE